ncbi:MAG: hypothetical protein ACI9KN_000848 [Gammaproteobacteria bacterium]|jgi:hypothetical protein
MVWTDTKDLQQQLEKLWDRGLVLSAYLDSSSFFPKRLVFKRPDSKQLSEQFGLVKEWLADLKKISGFRFETKVIQHRVLGQNELPVAVWIDDLDTVVAIIGKQKQLQRFCDLVTTTRRRAPNLLPWLHQYPLKALGYEAEWNQLIDILDWMKANPQPNIYLRQVDIRGVDSKFIERHKSILTRFLDITMPVADSTDSCPFEARYGFRAKPLSIRLRSLDPEINLIGSGDQDISVTLDNLASFACESRFDKIEKIIVTENEINFLSFPPLKNSLVIFGKGYGFDGFEKISWLNQRSLFYWGDIDTHGFAILDQLRSKLPRVKSLWMDRKTFLHHQDFWGVETSPQMRDLSRLDDGELQMYNDLRDNRFGHQLRLEQERIGYSYMLREIDKLCLS